MRKTFALLPLALAVGCWIGVDHGSGRLATERRYVDDFHALEVSGGLRVTASVGGAARLTVRTDDNLLHELDTYVSDGVLHVRWSGWSVHESPGTEVTLVAPHLTSLEASGGSNVFAAGYTGGPLAVSASGGSYVELHGRVDSFGANASGGSQLHADDLLTHRATLTGSGGSHLWVQCDGPVAVSLSGGSVCSLGGHPTRVDQSLSGGSTLRYDP